MEKQITIEKQKKLKNETMFNFKNVSLMKKQLFSLMMAFALVVGLSVSALAQAGLTVGNAVWHLPGSTHSLTVAGNTNSTYLWTVSSVACDGIAAGTNDVPTFSVDNAAACVFTYTSTAAGIYRFVVTETATDGGCTTAREFFTSIMSIDVVVNASDNVGATITGGQLASCSDYTLRRSETPATLVGNEDTDDNTNNLVAYTDAALFNDRWVNVTLTVSDNSGCTVANAPTASSFAWRFNYTVANGVLGNYVENFVSIQPVTNVTFTDATDETSTIEVAAGTTSITLPLRSNIRWGTDGTNADQEFTFTVDAGTAQLDDDATLDYTDGTEPATANGNNTSASQVIHASPATPRISVAY